MLWIQGVRKAQLSEYAGLRLREKTQRRLAPSEGSLVRTEMTPATSHAMLQASNFVRMTVSDQSSSNVAGFSKPRCAGINKMQT